MATSVHSTEETTLIPDDISSHRKVLETYELLESILLHVDIRTLLVSAQRVCTTWHSVITSSTPLQRHLFFLPVGDTPSLSDPDPVRPDYVLNPLLADTFPSFFPIARVPPEGPFDNVVELLPGYLPPPPRYGFLPAGDLSDITHLNFESTPMADAADMTRQKPFTKESASWRRMLVSQPPPLRVAHLRKKRWIEFIRGPTPRFRWNTALFHCSMIEHLGGMRMGELYDAVLEVNSELDGDDSDDVVQVHVLGYGQREEDEKAKRAWLGWKMGEAEYDETGYMPLDGEDGDGWLRRADLLLGDRVVPGRGR